MLGAKVKEGKGRQKQISVPPSSSYPPWRVMVDFSYFYDEIVGFMHLECYCVVLLL